jgi:hypothetical protein
LPGFFFTFGSPFFAARCSGAFRNYSSGTLKTLPSFGVNSISAVFFERALP